MDYTVSLDHDLEVVRLHVTGPQTLEAAQVAFPALTAAARSAGYSHFLVDVRPGSTGLDWLDLIDLIGNFDAYGFRRGDRIAVANHDAESGEWAELFAGNRGWQVQVFQTLEEAEASLIV